MIFSGILGAWFHVFLDGIYHYDVQPFWPGKGNPLYNMLSRDRVEEICIAFFVAAVMLYFITIIKAKKAGRQIN